MKQKIFQILLNRDQHISGEEISEKLNISRTAVWKHIKSLREDGYEIEAIQRKGYKLLNRVDKLLKTEILSNLNSEKWGKGNLFTFDEVDSTNLIAKKLANEGAVEGTFVVAEQQNAGKGRMGRVWSSPYGKGIWFSFVLRPDILPVRASEITFLIAVGIMLGIRKSTGCDARIKWPNDVLVDKKKVVGILTEISAEIERINYIIAGVGLNANQDLEDFDEEFRERAISLKIAKEMEIDRNKLLADLIEEIEKVYEIYRQEGFEPILKLWKDNNVTLGERVKVIMPKEEFFGRAKDIDDSGYLIVEDDLGKSHKIIAGDVSLRREDGRYA